MRLALRNFGVLGTSHRAGGLKKVASAPMPGLPFVVPTLLKFIQNGPKSIEGGAAQEVCKWLKIDEEEAFPAAVREAIQEPLQAKLHFYGQIGVIHVTTPDRADIPEEQALDELTQAHSAVLREFANARLGGLRLPPIQGALFTAPFAARLAQLNCKALRAAFEKLPDREQQNVSVARLEICIDRDTHYEEYEEAFERELQLSQEYADSLNMGSTPVQPWQVGKSS